MKRFATPAFSIATTLLALSGGALVFGQSPSGQLMSGYAHLSQTLDSKSAMQGQIVSAKLIGGIQTPEGLKLPNGTEILGHVDQVQASKDKGEASIQLTFDKAQLKDGRQLPIKATLIEIDAADSTGKMPVAVASDDKFDAELSVSGESLHSAVQNPTSGTIVRKDKDIRLVYGTRLLIAVEPASAGASAASGS